LNIGISQSEFSRACIEALREPLESGVINLARVAGEAAFPADFQLVCTMNPCPCGRPREGKTPCQCTPAQILLYRSRLSLPILDRIDLWVPIRSIDTEELGTLKPGTSTAAAREQVLMAYRRQRERQGCVNARLRVGEILVQARLGGREKQRWEQLAALHRLSARGAHRLLRVARTLADLDAAAKVRSGDLQRAAAWRTAF